MLISQLFFRYVKNNQDVIIIYVKILNKLPLNLISIFIKTWGVDVMARTWCKASIFSLSTGYKQESKGNYPAYSKL